MLQVHHLCKSYGVTTVLGGVSFVLNNGEHVGLIGPNGVGKTTLLRCIVGEEPPDSGSIALSPPGASIGYLAQALGEDLRESTVGAVLARAQADLIEAERGIQQAAEALASATGDVAVALADYDAALTRFEALGGYEREHRAASILDGLGLTDLDLATPAAALSGGHKTRLALALLLIREPVLLLLDEPTNHLDVEALGWLEGFVREYPGSALITSHDRDFLDRTARRILYLDPETRTVQCYEGGYSAFAVARAQEQERHIEAWRRQQEYVARVKRDVARLKSDALKIERSTTPRQPGVRKLARKKAQLAKSRERKLERYLTSEERVDKPRLRWEMNLEVARELAGAPPQSGRVVLEMEDVAFAYPGGSPLFTHLNLDVRYGQRIAIVGPNGAGKTTLLRLIEGLVQPTAGRVRLGANVRPGTLAQEQNTLDPARTVLETVLRACPMGDTEARSFLSMFLFTGDSVFRPVGACSPGERSRLQLALLVLRGCNLLLLDEPLNHLDIEAREHLETALRVFEGTVIAVSHDRAFLRAFAERVVEVCDGRAALFEGDYEFYARRRLALAR